MPSILQGLSVVLLLVLAGCTAPSAGPSPGSPVIAEGPPPATDGCPGHWHAMLLLVVANASMVLGEDARHRDAAEDPPGFHMHDADGVLHFHPHDGRCIPLGTSLEQLGITVTNGGFILGSGHGERAGSYPPSEGHRPELYAQAWGEKWVQVDLEHPTFFQDQVPDGTRLLLTYRDPATEPLEQQLGRVPDVPEAYRPS